MMSAPDWET